MIRLPNGQILSNEDVKSMNSGLAEALLALSSNADKQAKASQSDVKALRDITYGVIASNRQQNIMTCFEILRTFRKHFKIQSTID